MRVRTGDALAERLRFETLISEISSRFINVPATEVDSQIEEALGLICQFLGLERATIAEVVKGDQQLRVTHSWAAEGLEPIPVPTAIATEGLPWGSEKVFSGQMIMFSKVDDLPDDPITKRITLSQRADSSHEPVTVKQAFLKLGTKSHLTVPLSVGGSVLGVVCFATLRSEHVWPEDLTRRLRFVGEVFANALARKRSEDELARYRSSLEQVVHERTRDLTNANTQLRHEIKKGKKSEERLQELYEHELELRQQIEAEMTRRVEFTRMLAHEIKTPLTPVLASSDSLLAELEDERLLNLARNINRGACTLESRIDELLDLAKGEIGILDVSNESVDVLRLLREAAASMAPLAVNKVQSVGLALPSSLPPVRGDAMRIQQVVLNLLTNAIKFTPKGGRIRLRAAHDSGSVTVEVQDSGPGLSHEERLRVFEPYQRLSTDTGRLRGLGLGLALCKTLVELHGGRIWVKSRPSGGSTFGFSLPTDTAIPTAGSGGGSQLCKVLAIEDDEEIVGSVSLAFDSDWPEAALFTCTTGEEGMDWVEIEDPDIVILDLNLPDMSGFEVLRQLRLFSAVPVVVLTVREEEEDVAKALELGADDYLTKPFRKKELLARLRAQLRRHTTPDGEAPTVCGALRFDPATCQLKHGERDVNLTLIEGRIIHFLMRYPGQVVTHSRLSEAVWGEDCHSSNVSLRSHISRLRKKLETDPSDPRMILTKPGVGYWLAKP